MDFLDIMTTDFPREVYNGVTGIPSQVAQRGHEIRAEAFDGIEAGGDNLITAPSTYWAGLVFEAAGIVGHNVVKLPENTINIAGHGLDLSGYNGFDAQSEANLINAMIAGESSAFFGEVVPSMLGNFGETAYSVVSGDPMPFNVSVNVSSQGLSFGGTYSGNSQLLTDSATGLFVGSYTMGNLGYQGFNGKLTPGSFALPFATGANVASSLINANGSLLNQIESQYGISGGIQITPDGKIVFAEGSWGGGSSDPVIGSNPKKCN